MNILRKATEAVQTSGLRLKFEQRAEESERDVSTHKANFPYQIHYFSTLTITFSQSKPVAFKLGSAKVSQGFREILMKTSVFCMFL
jgi:hypothetical protein